MRQRWAHDLYVITDPTAPRGLEPYLEALADPALAGRWALQLRDHDADEERLRATIRDLAEPARRAHVPLLVGAASLERVRLAREEGATGAHLPERGPDAREVRAILGVDGWIGASIHDLAGHARRAAQGVDLVVVGPLRVVDGKGTPLTEPQLRALTARGGPPALALGGIRTAEDVAFARSTGCAGVSVRDLMARARSGAEVVRALRATLDGNETQAAVLDKLGP